METPKFCFFNPYQLVERINDKLRAGEGRLSLKNPLKRSPYSRFSVARRLDRRFRGIEKGDIWDFSIMQQFEEDKEDAKEGINPDSVSFNIFGEDDSRNEIGGIRIKTGDYDINTQDPRYYEECGLILRKQINLREGIVIPDCRVVIDKWDVGTAIETYRRRDRISQGSKWFESKIQEDLPTAWFLKQDS